MKTFLEEVAEKVYRETPNLENVTVVFPNRRGALYFRKHLSALLKRPAFAPSVVTIEDFIAGFSNLKVPDKLVLIARLYDAYQRVLGPDEGEQSLDSFEKFYFWGEMLLRDFEEVDKYEVNARLLFMDLSHQKELDANFDYLTQEQRDFLMNFWSNFDVSDSPNKQRFVRVWRRLGDLYDQFKMDLTARGFAYQGMLQRLVAEQLSTVVPTKMQEGARIVFAGFNALTTVEERILSFFVERYDARICWDTDTYYLNDDRQEAGDFFREYQQNPVLGKTFEANAPDHLQKKITSGAEIHLYGAAQPVGQAKLMAQVLRAELEKGLNPEETLIVLADENLLLPVLHGVAGEVENLNVTMGFPLGSTSFFNFIELLIELQISRKADHFNHRQVLALLGHPYVVAADPVAAHNKRKEILNENWVHIPESYLATQVPLHRKIFQGVGAASPSVSADLIRYLQSIIEEVGGLSSLGAFDKEYAFYFLKFFNQLDAILNPDGVGEGEVTTGDHAPDVKRIKSFLRLFRQLVRNQKIPFRGEPLKGLQIMGVLETRNLDFKNVFILSLNEGAFPSAANQGSYIPYNIRNAYGLPTLAHQDAMYAYLFYRSLQRAENIFLFYNSETDVLGQGEMSRYVQQLLFESGVNIRQHVLHNAVQPQGITPIVVKKSREILELLEKLNEGSPHRFRGMSPSALNSYIECRLQFYFRHVAKIKEPREVEDELDARVLGNFLHNVMELFYKNLTARKGTTLIGKEDFANAGPAIDRLIDRVFIEAYKLNPDKPVVYAGQRLVVREIVRRFATRIVVIDEAHTPFTIEALEKGDLTYRMKIERPPYEVILGGKIDRVDSKDEAIRVIDYKTGRDSLEFESIASLFSRDGKRNKAAFQTLLYALMYVHHHNNHAYERVVPGLINRMNLFDEGFTFGLTMGSHPVEDARALFPEFEERLKELVEELFDPAQPFDQTTNTDVCRYCPYREICYR